MTPHEIRQLNKRSQEFECYGRLINNQVCEILTLDPRHITLDLRHITLNPRHGTLDPRLSTKR